MIIIEENKDYTIPFRELNYGDVFRPPCDKSLYLKINNGDSYNAVDLTRNKMANFQTITRVFKYTGTLTVNKVIEDESFENNT